MTTYPAYVSLFSSAGLGCFGFKEAGFQCVATAELLPRRLEIQRSNEVCDDPEGYILGDLGDTHTQRRVLDKVEDWKKAKRSEIAAVIATPPCQGMSVANHKKKNELPRNSLVVESLKLINSIEPLFFVIENVRAFLKTPCLDVDGTVKPIGNAISENLGGKYNIESQTVNLKDYGSPSSRTRSLTIGIRRDIHDVTPSDVFPEKTTPPTLRQLIYDLPRLNRMGQISDDDIYHGYRSFDSRMRPWITELKEGQNAFENTDELKRPHRYVDGRVIPNKSSNGDKYRRNVWDKVAPCVHTRNDILASQSTIHPEDDRVFSIRELSLMMGVPDTFKWTPYSLAMLNELPIEAKRQHLRENELNIRQCLGEGVPTPVFQAMAERIYSLIGYASVKGRPNKSRRTRLGLRIADFISTAESLNSDKKMLAGFYTRQDTVFSLIRSLEKPGRVKQVRILEPSVGAGAFLPELIKHFKLYKVQLDLVDINPLALEQAKELVSTLDVPDSFQINYINSDFLSEFDGSDYDYVVGNPPFGAQPLGPGAGRSSLGLRDRYARFLHKAMQIGDRVAFVVPKTLLNGPEFFQLRNAISSEWHIREIQDYGESAFLDINIETIGISISPKSRDGLDLDTVITSIPMRTREVKKQSYITDSRYPSWLIFRNDFFDSVASQLNFGEFKSYRDRRLTKSRLSEDGDVPIVRARNIRPGSVTFDEDGPLYCSLRDVPPGFVGISHRSNLIVAPNLSYYPRAAKLPAGAYVDGSAAVLIPIDDGANPDVEYYSSPDFFYFYRIARNFSTRSLNIDSVSVHYWGIPRPGYRRVLEYSNFTPSSKDIFKIPDVALLSNSSRHSVERNDASGLSPAAG
ncbi:MULTISPECIES: DNA cytosine methyltransferase [Brevibacterium]|uniref:DNA (cytosine-5-)-methyltransferase n=1 Tax=Brevibacterium casei TaxID=33889 RepID=A0A7T4DJA9_9MICO|nr:DNA cytosine methyltransferase [Brevibacterium casei]QQB15260.1 DNA cytosine methyltransferase [Brevibacterium casei]